MKIRRRALRYTGAARGAPGLPKHIALDQLGYVIERVQEGGVPIGKVPGPSTRQEMQLRAPQPPVVDLVGA